jgi:hypothetical protein
MRGKVGLLIILSYFPHHVPASVVNLIQLGRSSGRKSYLRMHAAITLNHAYVLDLSYLSNIPASSENLFEPCSVYIKCNYHCELRSILYCHLLSVHCRPTPASIDIMAWEEPRKTGMQYRRLGNSGLHVSVFGLGGWLT